MSHDKVRAARINATQALWFVTIVTSVAVAAIMIWPYETARLLGSSEHLSSLVVTYLLWFGPSILFQMWLSVLLFIIRLDGSPQYAMWCNVVAALLTVILGWIFIFPLQLGIEGAALAATVATAVGGIMGVFYIIFKAKKLRIIAIKLSLKSMMLTMRNIGYQSKIGSSALLGEATLATLMFVGNQVFMKYLGDNGVGAFGIACYYTPFVFMVGNAIAQSAQPILSYNYGMNLRKRVSLTEKLALKTALMCGVAITIIFYFFPHWLVGLFLPLDNGAAKIAVAGLPLFFTRIYLLYSEPDGNRLLPEPRKSRCRDNFRTVARSADTRAGFLSPTDGIGRQRYMACHAGLRVHYSITDFHLLFIKPI